MATPRKQQPKKPERPKLIRLGMLNIEMHRPHSPERYVRLFQQAFSMGAKVQLDSLHVCMLGQLDQPDLQDSTAPLAGEIFRFVQLDPSDPWFNTRTNRPADDNEVEQINIPDHLLPHLQRVPFVFFPHAHRLVVVTRMGRVAAYQQKRAALGPSTAAKFFRRLFGQDELRQVFNQVNVTTIPRADAVSAILAMPQIERLTMVLTRPNPGDDGEDESKRLLQRMEQQNARRVTIELDAADAQGLTPDEQTQDVAEQAAQSGHVTAKVRESGRVVERSTEGMPRIEVAELRERTQSLRELLKQSLGLFQRPH